MKRDPKGLYKKALNGEIKNFTGVNAPYEEPQKPEIIIRTDKKSVDECVDRIFGLLREKEFVLGAKRCNREVKRSCST